MIKYNFIIINLLKKRLIDLMSFTIFVHCDDDIRLSRRSNNCFFIYYNIYIVIRDVKERGRDVTGILT